MKPAKLFCFILALGTLGCATGMADQSSMPPFETVVRYGEIIGFAPLSEDTTHISELELDLLPVRAVEIHWQGREPTPELVLVEHSGKWRATLGDKTRLPGWNTVVKSALGLSGDQLTHLLASEEGAARLASDLSLLLVDPDPSLGQVVASVGEIPLLHRLSDVRRALEREGLPAEEIDKRLLSRSPQYIEAPDLRRLSEDSAVLSFTTWNLHGGRLERWQINFGRTPSVRVELLAEGTGSFRNFFF